MCRIVLSATPPTPPQATRDVRNETPSAHTPTSRSKAPHRTGFRKEPKRIDSNSYSLSYSNPRTSKGQNGAKLAIKSREVTEEKVIMIEDIHTEG